jgi:hypothetical protein
MIRKSTASGLWQSEYKDFSHIEETFTLVYHREAASVVTLSTRPVLYRTSISSSSIKYCLQQMLSPVIMTDARYRMLPLSCENEMSFDG